MNTIIPEIGESPLSVLKRCGGYYSQEDTDGPLVGYAGKYKAPDGTEKQYVGYVYANFAKAEEHGVVLDQFGDLLLERLRGEEADDGIWHLFTESTGFCGLPLGGLSLAAALAMKSGKQLIFPEKMVTKARTKSSREESELVFDRHEPEKDGIYWLVEDVANNFSTTKKSIELVERHGAEVAGLVCFLNRSLEVGVEYQVREGMRIPVISLVRRKIMQWEQEDPRVADDIARGNIVWKPKNEWHRIAPFVN